MKIEKEPKMQLINSAIQLIYLFTQIKPDIEFKTAICIAA